MNNLTPQLPLALLMTPERIDLDFDGNFTSVLGDSTKNVNLIISQLVEAIKYQWAPGTEKKSFKDFVQQDLHPGNKRDENVKRLQNKEIDSFLVRIKQIHEDTKARNPIYNAGMEAKENQNIAQFLNKYKELRPDLYEEAKTEVLSEIDFQLNELIEKGDPIYDEARIRMHKAEYLEARLFETFMNNLGAPIYKKTMNYYHRLVKNYIDPKTQKVIFKVFPSVIKLVERLQKNHKTSFSLRTFGKDRNTIAQCLTDSGIPMTRNAKMKSDGMILEGETEVLLQGYEILKAREIYNLAIQDNFDHWAKNSEIGPCGKIIHCVKDTVFKDPQSTEEQPICSTRVAIFFDDNLKIGKEKFPNPQERNIGFPKDIYDRPVAWIDPGFIAIRVNSVKAALDEDYFVRKVIKEFRKRGFNTSHLESKPESI